MSFSAGRLAWNPEGREPMSRSASGEFDMDHPTTRREQISMMPAMWSQPSWIQNRATSVARISSGPEARKSRFMRPREDGTWGRSRRRSPPPEGAHQSVHRHEPGDSFLTAPVVQATERFLDTGSAIGGPGPAVDLGDRLSGLGVPLGPPGLKPALSVAIAGAGDLKHLARPLDAELLGVIGDRPEAGHRIVSLTEWGAA